MNNRQTFRADWHDYNTGIYFVTICAKDMKNLFGYISNNKMHYNPTGDIVVDEISKLTTAYDYTEIIKYVIMPNHIHLLINIRKLPNHDSTKPQGCLKPMKDCSYVCDDYPYNTKLALFIRKFKATCSHRVDKEIWQRSFHEHIVRSRESYFKIYNYIELNVFNWRRDCFYNK